MFKSYDAKNCSNDMAAQKWKVTIINQIANNPSFDTLQFNQFGLKNKSQSHCVQSSNANNTNKSMLQQQKSHPVQISVALPEEKAEIQIKQIPVNKFEVELLSLDRVYEMKKSIEKCTGVKIKKQKLTFCTMELKQNNKYLNDLGIFGQDLSQTPVYLSIKSKFTGKATIQVYSSLKSTLSKSMLELLKEVQLGLDEGFKMELSLNGQSGTYFMKNHKQQTVAVFKPHDEEPFTPNNPKQLTNKMHSESFRPGILSGEGAAREVAVYLLDAKIKADNITDSVYEISTKNNSNNSLSQSNMSNQQTQQTQKCQIKPGQKSQYAKNDKFYRFHGVPETTYVEIQKEQKNFKQGSLQEFVKHNEIAGDLGCGLFSDDEVHKIAILDLRILNCDRNEENILVRKTKTQNLNQTKETPNKGQQYKYQLIPIDHGLSFPDCITIFDHWIVWMEWPQVKQPFSEQEKEFIKNINIENDIKMLKSKLVMRQECLDNFRIANMILKTGAEHGLTLFEIGQLVYSRESDKQDEQEQSALQKLIEQANDLANDEKVSQHNINKALNKQNANLPSLPITKQRTQSTQYQTLSNHSFSKKGKERKSLSQHKIKCQPTQKVSSQNDNGAKNQNNKQDSIVNVQLQDKMQKHARNDIFFHFLQEQLTILVYQKLKLRKKS